MNLLFNDDGSKRDYTLKQNGTYRVSNLNEPCGEYLTTTSAMKEIEKEITVDLDPVEVKSTIRILNQIQTKVLRHETVLV